MYQMIHLFIAAKVSALRTPSAPARYFVVCGCSEPEVFMGLRCAPNAEGVVCAEIVVVVCPAALMKLSKPEKESIVLWNY